MSCQDDGVNICSLHHNLLKETFFDRMANFLWSLLWLLGLIFIGWPVAGILAGIYVFILPFTVCINPCKGLGDILLRGVQLPHLFAEGIVQGKPMC